MPLRMIFSLTMSTTTDYIDSIDGDTDFFGSHTRLPRTGERGHRECKSDGRYRVSENRAIRSRGCTKGVTASSGRGECVELSTSMEIWQKPWLMDELSAHVRPFYPSVRPSVRRESPVKWIEAIRNRAVTCHFSTSLGKYAPKGKIDEKW